MRGCGQLWKQMGLLPVPPPPTSRQDEPEGQAVVLQLAEHAPPGQPVGIPNTVSAMQKPLVGGRHWVSVVHAVPTCDVPASSEVHAPAEHESALEHEAHWLPRRPQVKLFCDWGGTQKLLLQQPAQVAAEQAKEPPPPPVGIPPPKPPPTGGPPSNAPPPPPTGPFTQEKLRQV